MSTVGGAYQMQASQMHSTHLHLLHMDCDMPVTHSDPVSPEMLACFDLMDAVKLV